jgi:hypothetical protein
MLHRTMMQCSNVAMQHIAVQQRLAMRKYHGNWG